MRISGHCITDHQAVERLIGHFRSMWLLNMFLCITGSVQVILLVKLLKTPL